MRVRAFRVVDVPIDQVWQTLADHEGMSRWSPGVSVTLETPGSPDRNGVGAVRRVKGNGMTIREEITAFEPGSRLAYRALSGLPFRGYHGEVVVVPQVSGTAITWVIGCAHDSMVIRVVLRSIAGLFLSALTRAVKRTAAKNRR